MSKTTNKFSPEVRERAVRMVLDNQGQHGSRWSAILSISTKIGCAPQTLNEWIKRSEVDSGKRAGIPGDLAEKMKALERENRELRQANEILRKGEPVKAPLVQAHWRTHILRWRSSTADTRHDRLHKRSSGQTWAEPLKAPLVRAQ
jgi:transposase